jgi:hypothetical protein
VLVVDGSAAVLEAVAALVGDRLVAVAEEGVALEGVALEVVQAVLAPGTAKA